MPDTVQGVLAARIDRLPDEPASVCRRRRSWGGSFRSRLLGRDLAGPGHDRAAPAGAEATRAALRAVRYRHRPVYVFKHALTQDVAYGSLLVSRRETLHAAATRAWRSCTPTAWTTSTTACLPSTRRPMRPRRRSSSSSRFAAQAAGAYAHAEASEALRKALAQVGRLARGDAHASPGASSCWRWRAPSTSSGASTRASRCSPSTSRRPPPWPTRASRAPIASGWPTRTSHLGEGHLEAVRHRAGGARRGSAGRATLPLLARPTTCSAARDAGPGSSPIGAEHGRQAVEWLERAGERVVARPVARLVGHQPLPAGRLRGRARPGRPGRGDRASPRRRAPGELRRLPERLVPGDPR